MIDIQRPLAEIVDATADWLTAVLAAGGYLTSGAVSTVAFDSDKSANARNGRLLLSYTDDADGPDPLPTRLFLKLVDSDAVSTFGDSEVEYYTVITRDMHPSPAPHCYHAASSKSPDRYHLLLEDLSESHVPCWDRAPTWDDAALTVDMIADLHAHWWDSPDLASSIGRWPTVDVVERSVDQARRGLQPMFDAAGSSLAAADQDLIRRILATHPSMMMRRGAVGKSLTCIHGDLNPGNILIPREGQGGRAYLIDRQPFDWSLTTWLGASDLAYMMVHWWEPETRRALEARLLVRYHARLLSLRVTDYSIEDLWSDYRLSAMQSLYVAAGWCADPVEVVDFAWVWKVQLRRTMESLVDLRCEELL